jgi:hypothetical protein
VNGLEEYLIAGMSASMLRNKIDAKLSNGYISELFVEENKVVVRDWNANKMYEMSYTIDGEEITLSTEKTEVALIWKPIDQVQESDLRIAELEKENEELKAQLAETEKIEESIVEDKVEVEVEAEVKSESSDKVIAYAEAIATLTETVATLKSHIAELEPYRLEAVRVAEEKAKAEIEARKAELKLMAEKVVKEELTAEMNDAIESQDENSLKLLIADFVIANVKPSESIVEEKQEDVVIASSTKDEEYIVQKEQKIRLF